jgi:hypothetical protein
MKYNTHHIVESFNQFAIDFREMIKNEKIVVAKRDENGYDIFVLMPSRLYNKTNVELNKKVLTTTK